eukprot:CAMPEP_0202965968 /NCGR_PEP_ID=MMETSP1396-20130829/10162_1 /ASSEMBLY_ACC=CAM_ASM_000872 /TAXON_ID= /ORGANISM="Pseudokeronopsis sp., Strain Brazil" /LENGTH=60 /DNA_ID=CAMNT_0049689263 /DNA_START=214 /DNA_END=396 /DNA_ORIENTATION=-
MIAYFDGENKPIKFQNPYVALKLCSRNYAMPYYKDEYSRVLEEINNFVSSQGDVNVELQE